MAEQEVSEQDEVFLVEQLVVRLGRKRVLEAIQARAPDDYSIVQRVTLLSSIASVSLLATVLWPLWRELKNLAPVCKRFAEAVKHRNFWLPAVRQQLLLRFPKEQALIATVNPFLEIPPDIYVHVAWPWWTWLKWLFQANLVSCGNTKQFARAHIKFQLGQRTITYYRHLNGSGIEIWISPTTKNNTDYRIAYGKIDLPASNSGWAIAVNGKRVWFDGYLLTTAGEKKRWRGILENGHYPPSGFIQDEDEEEEDEDNDQ